MKRILEMFKDEYKDMEVQMIIVHLGFYEGIDEVVVKCKDKDSFVYKALFKDDGKITEFKEVEYGKQGGK